MAVIVENTYYCIMEAKRHSSNDYLFLLTMQKRDCGKLKNEGIHDYFRFIDNYFQLNNLFPVFTQNITKRLTLSGSF